VTNLSKPIFEELLKKKSGDLMERLANDVVKIENKYSPVLGFT